MFSLVWCSVDSISLIDPLQNSEADNRVSGCDDILTLPRALGCAGHITISTPGLHCPFEWTVHVVTNTFKLPLMAAF